MKSSAAKIISLLLALVLSFGLAACAKKTAPMPAEEPSASAEPSVSAEPSASAEATPAVPTPEPDSPAGRAAAKGLPAPPDIDINSRKFIFNNSYNSIMEYNLEGHYSGVGGQGADIAAVMPVQSLMNAAREAGLSIYIPVGYRDYEWLMDQYCQLMLSMGTSADAAEVFLGPGLNEHQTGFAFDFTDDAAYSALYHKYDASGIEDTELYSWLCEHCAEYGLILRYPKGKENYYGTACNCPAHFRYVGVEAATYIMENDLCLEEFLLLYDPDAVFVPKQ